MSPDEPRPYGPRTPHVRHFLRRLAAQPAVVWLAAARRWADGAADTRRQRADRALGDTIARAGRETERDALVGPILQLARRAAAFPAGDDDVAHVERLAEPALAAALALLVADLLPAVHVERLYEPFADAIPLDADDGPTP